ncbi:MAG: PTS sugar transporter subunit IIA [Ignavibacteriaceae bacterium]|nr:PTS sugar transporter subunit IIA [Ignavibacteriaceae bacterium]
MDLTIKDISVLLLKPEKEIQGLIKKKEIPFQTINDKLLFNKQQIIEWALSRNIPINISNHEKMSEYHVETLNTILDENSFFYDCDLSEKTYIEQMVNLIDLEKNVDKGIIVQLLKNREELMSTAIGNGISLPHPRIPLMVGKNKPLINFFFPKNPLDLKSLDEKPVHTIILMISQTIKQHLSMLAHLSFLLSQEAFRFALANRLNYKEIIDIISHIEDTRNK